MTKEALARTETPLFGEEVALRAVVRWLDLLSCVCLVLLECNVFCLTQTAFLSI